MNTQPGLIGKKLGNTQIFNAEGLVHRVTAIEVGPNVVIGKRTPERDGYSALVLGFGEKREKSVNKPEGGLFKKLGQKAAAIVKEIRLPAETVAKYEVGAQIKASEIFAEGQLVDVSGDTKGRGFTGVMVRHNFKGSRTQTHGTHEYQRHGGAIGTNMTPGRVFPGVKMPGQWGASQVTIQNLRVAKVLDDQNIVLVEGGVPGSKQSFVTVRTAVKAKRQQA
ncbi:MAG TPA: 50S ribosomal protein L3 [Polyangiales bacterium]|nr:50S ribosomal protein L3 [Polyangiales bacterium]